MLSYLDSEPKLFLDFLQYTHQAAALLAILDPGVPTVVQGFPILMETLTAKPWVTFRAAKKINRGILTVTDHPSTHHKSILYEKEEQHLSKASITQYTNIHMCMSVCVHTHI